MWIVRLGIMKGLVECSFGIGIGLLRVSVCECRCLF